MEVEVYVNKYDGENTENCKKSFQLLFKEKQYAHDDMHSR